MVALLTESVDRNFVSWLETESQLVALLTESVDRNQLGEVFVYQFSKVALLTESVDRNIRSPPAAVLPFVALLTESVDRNKRSGGRVLRLVRSLSSRRAWIEMYALYGWQ